MVQSTNERHVILILENEFLVRTTTAEAIRDAGFEVVEAGDADAAIVILESRRGIQVVFTDFHFPGSIDGAELARLI